MPEINLNQNLVEILTEHGIESTSDNEFIYVNLSSRIKFKARAIYQKINNLISSQLDVMVVTDTGECIIESFGDWGKDLNTVINKNLLNFSMSSLHPILTAFGTTDIQTVQQVTIEEWEINGYNYTAYIGNLVPKTNSSNPNLKPPAEFFEAIVDGINSRAVNNEIHWFRGYYLQSAGEIKASEFLMDNVDITNNYPIFSSIPVIPDVEIYSCRNFIILKRISNSEH
jgi:hypothetical protein